MSNSDREIVYGNVGLLDIRKATGESVAGITRIENLGLLIYAPETAALAKSLRIGNLGSSVEASPDRKVEMGPMRLNANALRSTAKPLDSIIMGPLLVDADVSVADLEGGVERLIVMGPVTCPDSVVLALQSKTDLQMGPVNSYPAPPYGGELVAISRTFHLNHETLATMKDHSTPIVHGRLVVAEPLPADLVERKVHSLTVLGSALRSPQNAPLLRTLMRDYHLDRLKVLPEGFKVMERALTIDSTFLRFGSVRKLYCCERVTVDRAVTAAEIEQHLDGLRCANLVLAPVALRDALAPKCDLVHDQVLFYAGTLWMEDAVSKLTAERFASLDGVVTLFVDGLLEVDRDVTPGVLNEKLAQVNNFGTITGTPSRWARCRRAWAATVACWSTATQSWTIPPGNGLATCASSPCSSGILRHACRLRTVGTLGRFLRVRVLRPLCAIPRRDNPHVRVSHPVEAATPGVR